MNKIAPHLRGRAGEHDLGKLLFTFGLVTDGHVKPEEGDDSSPWAVNLLANGRNRYVVRELNQLQPAFVINMGDLVHPVPVLPSYGRAAETFHDIYAKLDCPLHVIPGNHDVGDKPVDWMPAGLVDQHGVDQFRKHFGDDYSSFDRDGCHFVLINNVICNSGIPAEIEQRAWLEADLAANDGKRIFLFMHYPPYITETDETGSYDNIEEPARSWLLSLIERHGVEAMFSGHVHNFFYDRHAKAEIYVLPSITFYRHDHGDFFRSPPLAESEDGRNDLGKFGFFEVKIHENGHVARLVRTWGGSLDKKDEDTPATARLRTRHTKESGMASLGVHMRHPWTEIIEFPYTGPLDEFGRKRARNDYPLAALWELGAHKMRVPLSDLADTATRRRMGWLQEIGHAFTVFTFGTPDQPTADLLGRHASLVDTWEVVLPWNDNAAAAKAIHRIKEETGLRVLINKLETSAEKVRQGSKFSHFVNHGIDPADGEALTAFLSTDDGAAAADGFVFRATMDDSPWEVVEAARQAAGPGMRAAVTVRLAIDNPALGNRDDDAIAARVAEASLAAMASPDIDVFLDTFIDLDRGYFVRHGLFDRRCNPRPAAHVYRHLHSALADGPVRVAGCQAIATGQVWTGETAQAAFYLVLPDKPGDLTSLPVATGENDAGNGRWIDLVDGQEHAVTWQWKPADAGGQLTFAPALPCAGPSLLMIETGGN